MKLWIDGDACPKEIRELTYKAALRKKIQLKYIANSYHKIPVNPLFEMVVVDRSPDAADEHIVSHITPGDLVITSDLPLAYEAVLKKAHVISPKGSTFTEANIRERLSMRDLMQDLRSSGLVSGGPSSFSPRDKMNFANALDRILTQGVGSKPLQESH